MITPVGVLQENKEAALTAITELQKTIADSTSAIESYRVFIAEVDKAVSTLLGGVESSEKDAQSIAPQDVDGGAEPPAFADEYRSYMASVKEKKAPK